MSISLSDFHCLESTFLFASIKSLIKQNEREREGHQQLKIFGSLVMSLSLDAKNFIN